MLISTPEGWPGRLGPSAVAEHEAKVAEARASEMDRLAIVAACLHAQISGCGGIDCVGGTRAVGRVTLEECRSCLEVPNAHQPT